MNPVLVLGIGNDILKDDVIGIRLARDLEASGEFSGVRFDTTSMGGLEILEMIREYHTVIILDAIKTAGGVPGEVYYYSPDDFRETLNLANLHDINFLTSLELARRIGMKVPETVHILAVEILEDLEFGSEMTPPLQQRYPQIFQEIKFRIKNLLSR